MLREGGGRRGCAGSMMDHGRCRIDGSVVSAVGLSWFEEGNLSLPMLLCTNFLDNGLKVTTGLP